MAEWILNHWTTKEVLVSPSLKRISDGALVTEFFFFFFLEWVAIAFSASSGTPIIRIVCLILSQGYLRLSSVLFILFTLFCSSEVILTSSRSLIHSSASDILLLIPSRLFLISVIVLSVYVYSFIFLGLC